ncbi:class I glutamine amidotransferase-like protein [Durotheca rogersii]|uniref:class I glutamine amidotransferase-like protein n=1 Tax=Durotheca rogersii TaxID=419775 RepID=UPI00221E3CAE|nr:class I glutamine amidotransferase-like protein [Durotheca rogersii]KAI5867580.1 class I glutamine amidotransferase-like protein [Durotheca rogersii]
MAAPTSPPLRFAVALFPGFQALDAFGPLDVLNVLSRRYPISIRVLAATREPVSTRTPLSGHAAGEAVAPTHTFAETLASLPPADDGTSPDGIDVLIVPGGAGVREPLVARPVEDFVRAVYPRLRFLLTVCTGSVIAARAGVLEGLRATTNKRSWEWGPDVRWVARARWVVDGRAWTSSGISAGIDMAFAFVANQFGEDVARDIADAAEHSRRTDPNDDPFAERWGAKEKE